MKKSTIITILAFALGLIILAGGFILFTDNNISDKLFATTTTTVEPPKPYDPIDFFDVDINQYVTLGQYKNLTVKVDSTVVSEEYVQEQIDNMLISNEKIEEVKTGIIEEDVLFSFDYKGYHNGVAFDKGEAKDTWAYISDGVFYLYSGTIFIDGFAQGIINHNVGETFQIEARFPDYYPNNTDLAGQVAVFDITINYIVKAQKLTDELVNELTQGIYKTVGDFHTYAVDFFKEELKSNNENTALMQAISNSKFNIPAEEKTYYYDSIYAEIETYASMYQMTPEMFLQYGGGEYLLSMSIYSLAQLESYIENYLKENIFIIAIIEAEGLEVTQEEYDLFLESLVEQLGATKEEIVAEYTEEYIKQIILSDEAYAIIWDTAEYVTE